MVLWEGFFDRFKLIFERGIGVSLTKKERSKGKTIWAEEIANGKAGRRGNDWMCSRDTERHVWLQFAENAAERRNMRVGT